MRGVHIHRVDVRFGDCDPAGIVYFPRFFHLFHEAMETWFSAGLGLSYAQLILGRKLGFPAVHTEADFNAPCALGEAIAVELRVARLGRSSIGLEYVVRGVDGVLRLTGASTCVVMDLDPASPSFRRAVAMPDELRARIEHFMAGESAVPEDS
ncbi:acyl-CoA thioesterase [Nannocystis sp.]|uniref:acyl-CoA thioesterase n=1 Tax=Nannocystis sp. TaxID=1962667 RepID=UPI0025DACC38|nr:acyl-CoA thioesterase [Nannocystis sp.]MBK7827622.1 acyl-CoA thioesterase [Nannocystis sp.]